MQIAIVSKVSYYQLLVEQIRTKEKKKMRDNEEEGRPEKLLFPNNQEKE